ncbi:MAG: beta-ketoacyl-[acyl-carrier-protein] synthase family protein [Dokdonella sp.]
MPAARNDVMITGMGAISPIGLSMAETYESLLKNRSGISFWESPLLSKGIPGGVIQRDFSSEFTRLERPYVDRCSQIALLAAREALRDAGIEQFEGHAERAGIYYGTIGGGVNTAHDWFRQFYADRVEVAKPFTVMASMFNAAPALISIRHKILGPVITNSSACSSSGAAIGEASRAIRDGYLDVALVGGAEAAFNPSFVAAWNGLRALAQANGENASQSCRPFDTHRTGLVMSEGAVFMLIESREHAEKRGADCYCRLSGYGIASDGYHIGSPNTQGQSAALRAALADSGLQPGQIGYFNAHATATRGGDPVEAAAIRSVFGAATEELPVSSTKGIHGHLLGAASAMELAVCVLSITQSFIPATANLEDVDPECQLKHVSGEPIVDYPVEHALSFSAGFGGTNVALAVSKEHDLGTKKVARSPFNA